MRGRGRGDGIACDGSCGLWKPMLVCNTVPVVFTGEKDDHVLTSTPAYSIGSTWRGPPVPSSRDGVTDSSVDAVEPLYITRTINLP